jgi:hypothetical protein
MDPVSPLSPGTILIAIGVGLILTGLLLWSGSLSWFGRLPGDIRIERESVRIYVPVVSMLVVSLVVSLALYLLRRFR